MEYKTLDLELNDLSATQRIIAGAKDQVDEVKKDFEDKLVKKDKEIISLKETIKRLKEDITELRKLIEKYQRAEEKRLAE